MTKFEYAPRTSWRVDRSGTCLICWEQRDSSFGWLDNRCIACGASRAKPSLLRRMTPRRASAERQVRPQTKLRRLRGKSSLR